jgi:hypothetical protein
MYKFLMAAGLAALAVAGAPAQASDCIGNCGTTAGGIQDGVIVPAPTGDGSYQWVSTFGGQFGAARIAGFEGGATNGSELISDPFFAAAGQKVAFWFNYVTSDGSTFADYGFSQLLKTSGTPNTVNLFTARTRPTGVIVPGFNLPDVEAELTPANVFIIPGGPTWSPLGGSSGACFGGFNGGCGYTGWINSVYEIQEAGTYQLRFGASNFSDTAFDSGLAFSGLLLDGSTIGDGSSFESPLLPSEIGEDGAFEFTFVAEPLTPVVIDPFVATGYVFESNVAILSAEWENLGDTNGYDIFTLDDILIAENFVAATGNVLDFTSLGFANGILGFKVLDIDKELMLDPDDQTAFKSKLLFNVTGPTTINITQTPIETFVPDAVPEPATWAMMIGGFGLLGSAVRRRRSVSAQAIA